MASTFGSGPAPSDHSRTQPTHAPAPDIRADRGMKETLRTKVEMEMFLPVGIFPWVVGEEQWGKE